MPRSALRQSQDSSRRSCQDNASHGLWSRLSVHWDGSKPGVYVKRNCQAFTNCSTSEMQQSLCGAVVLCIHLPTPPDLVQGLLAQVSYTSSRRQWLRSLGSGPYATRRRSSSAEDIAPRDSIHPFRQRRSLVL